MYGWLGMISFFNTGGKHDAGRKYKRAYQAIESHDIESGNYAHQLYLVSSKMQHAQSP